MAMMAAADDNGEVPPEATLLETKPKFEKDEDPLNFLGYGMVSYFNMIQMFVVVFFVMTLLHLPNLYLFSKWSNYKGSKAGLTATTSIGNMGFATTKCVNTAMNSNQIVFSCVTGQISQIVDFGYISPKEDDNVCLRDPKGECANSFSAKLAPDLKAACIGKDAC